MVMAWTTNILDYFHRLWYSSRVTRSQVETSYPTGKLAGISLTCGRVTATTRRLVPAILFSHPMTYTEYMQSDKWAAKRKARLDMDNHTCRLCGSTDNLEVHHRPDSYQLIPHESVAEHLTTVCHDCHRLITNRIRRARYSKRKIQLTHFSDERKVRKDVDHGLANTVLSPDIRLPDAHARRDDLRPATPDHESYEAGKREARQDGRRS